MKRVNYFRIYYINLHYFSYTNRIMLEKYYNARARYAVVVLVFSLSLFTLKTEEYCFQFISRRVCYHRQMFTPRSKPPRPLEVCIMSAQRVDSGSSWLEYETNKSPPETGPI